MGLLPVLYGSAQLAAGKRFCLWRVYISAINCGVDVEASSSASKVSCLCKLRYDTSLKTFSEMLYGENRCLWYLTDDHRAGLTDWFRFCLNLEFSLCVLS